jgi:hypothetical protein
MEEYKFAARLSYIDGKFVQYILIVPDEIIEQINKKGRIRTKGTMNGYPFALAIQHLKTGERYFLVSAALRKAAKIQMSVPVQTEFVVVDENELDIPEELTAVLNEDPEGQAAFDKLTTGSKRGLIHYVTSVKNLDSRIKRAMQLVEKAKMGLLSVQRKQDEE